MSLIPPQPMAPSMPTKTDMHPATPPWGCGVMPPAEQRKRVDSMGNTARCSVLGSTKPAITVTTVEEFPAVHDFFSAFNALRAGTCDGIARLGWSGYGLRVHVQIPDAHSKMTACYAYIETPQGDRTPWVPSQGDLFATDWAIIG